MCLANHILRITSYSSLKTISLHLLKILASLLVVDEVVELIVKFVPEIVEIDKQLREIMQFGGEN